MKVSLLGRIATRWAIFFGKRIVPVFFLTAALALFAAGCEDDGDYHDRGDRSEERAHQDVQKTWTVHVRSNTSMQPISGAWVDVYFGFDWSQPMVSSQTDTSGDAVFTFVAPVYDGNNDRNDFEIVASAVGFAGVYLDGAFTLDTSAEFTMYLPPL